MYKVKLSFLEVHLSLTKIQGIPENPHTDCGKKTLIEHSVEQPKAIAGAGTHVQSQTQNGEFDLSLTKSQFSAKNPFRNTCTESNSLI